MRLAYQGVVDADNPFAFAPWVRALRGFSGVYVIRAAGAGTVGGEYADQGEVLYVGESHTARLYSTLTRHFQNGLGPTNRYYERDLVEVAAFLCEGADAVALQDAEILRLTPRDNAQLPF